MQGSTGIHSRMLHSGKLLDSSESEQNRTKLLSREGILRGDMVMIMLVPRGGAVHVSKQQPRTMSNVSKQ
jgi:hypothetical protein